ncbi:hypothetical protein ACIRYZ_41650 [Kitasatospora sp. NPDC101155]|uniref:hypothetical protein n=1 Tax=Kitasatospora sp. NPDC101155 TaxID=3364097 RepID=UPI00382428D6
MNGKSMRHPGMRRTSGLTAAALMGVGTLLGSGGTALANAAPAALSAPQYVEQSNPPQPNSWDSGYQVGLQLGHQAANVDFKHGQTSRAFTKYPTVSGNDPRYVYQTGVLAGTKDGYTEQMESLMGKAVGPVLPFNPVPEHPYYPGPAEKGKPSPSCGWCAPGPNTTNPNTTNPNTTNPNTGGSSTTGPNTTSPNTGGSSTTGPNTTSPNTGGSSTTSPNTNGPDMGGSSTTSPNTNGPDTGGSSTTSPNTTSQSPTGS